MDEPTEDDDDDEILIAMSKVRIPSSRDENREVKTKSEALCE